MTKTAEQPLSSPSTGRLAALVAAGIAIAGMAHFFLDLPIDFLKDGQGRAWMGLTIWAPSLLAALALFMEVGLKDRLEVSRISDQIRAAGAVLIPLAALALLAHLHLEPDYWRPVNWKESLLFAAALHTGVFVVGVLFWQGLVQRQLLAEMSPLMRVPLTAALGLLVWVPFIVQTGWERAVEGYLLDYGILYLACALIFELGLQVRFVMVGAAIIGIGYTWAHQGLYF